MSKEFECSCKAINPAKGKVHVVTKIFYGDKVWAMATLHKDTEDYQKFMDNVGMTSFNVAKTLAKAGALTGEFAESYREEMSEETV